MPQIPGWYAAERDQHARLILEGEETQEAALVSLRLLVRDKHVEFGNKILDEWNGAELNAAIAAAKPKPVPVPTEALVILAERGHLTTREAIALAGDSSNHADAAIKAMVDQGLAETVNGRIIPTDEGRAAAEEAKIWGLQRSLFPLVPIKLRATPGRYRPTPFMSGHELDMAKKVWMNKTKHAIEGAEAEQARLNAFYNKVRPLISDTETVAQALRKLAAKQGIQV